MMDAHRPERGSDVELYLASWAVSYPNGSPMYWAARNALDEYQRRADAGRPLVTEDEWAEYRGFADVLAQRESK